MSDLVARLRDADTTRRIGESYADTHERRQRDRDEAADTITTLRAEVETVGAMHRDACELAKHRMQEVERLRADNERLRAALRDIDHARYTGRNTINPDNAFQHAISLNEKLIAVMDIARAALIEDKTCSYS
jgi:hypothetical protein